MKEIFKNKKNFKHRYRKCCICNESNYDLLDIHRWKKTGAEGGKYTSDNSVCICTKCHRLVHKKKIFILGIFTSSSGKVINYIDINGIEKFNNI